MCTLDDDGRLIHFFEVEAEEPTPRETVCTCGEVTWGEMDDLLTLTLMWQATR